jgi:hypothetical protein
MSKRVSEESNNQKRADIAHIVNVLINSARDGKYDSDEHRKKYNQFKRMIDKFQPAEQMTDEEWADWKALQTSTVSHLVDFIIHGPNSIRVPDVIVNELAERGMTTEALKARWIFPESEFTEEELPQPGMCVCHDPPVPLDQHVRPPEFEQVVPTPEVPVDMNLLKRVKEEFESQMNRLETASESVDKAQTVVDKLLQKLDGQTVEMLNEGVLTVTTADIFEGHTGADLVLEKPQENKYGALKGI